MNLGEILCGLGLHQWLRVSLRRPDGRRVRPRFCARCGTCRAQR